MPCTHSTHPQCHTQTSQNELEGLKTETKCYEHSDTYRKKVAYSACCPDPVNAQNHMQYSIHIQVHVHTPQPTKLRMYVHTYVHTISAHTYADAYTHTKTCTYHIGANFC
jgi:hypothetical protein